MKFLISGLLIASNFLGAGAASASTTDTRDQIGQQQEPGKLAFEPHCFPSAGLAAGGGTVTAYGSGTCRYMPPITLGVTVIMYENGWNVDSTYNSCYLASDGDCAGYSISIPNSGGNYCSKVVIDYTEPNTGAFKQFSTSNGAGCP